MAISNIAIHPKKSILATASDDYTWKIWTLPAGELIMSGSFDFKGKATKTEFLALTSTREALTW